MGKCNCRRWGSVIVAEHFQQLSRKELSATICEHLGWYTAAGSNKIDACMKLLEKFENQGIVKLPEKRTSKKSTCHRQLTPLTGRTQSESAITGALSSLGQVNLAVVTDKETTTLWREYVTRYHYLGYKKPFGFYLRYFFKCDRGLLGCALFAGAAKSIGVRDNWIGWTETRRLRNLAWIINNSRFLIFPWVQVKNLASHVLGLIYRQIGYHWEKRWGYRPVLMETFVDPNHYQGTCYKAANWHYLGMTTGIGLPRRNKIYTTTAKKIFLKPLVKNYRQLLCSDGLVGRTEI